MQKKSKKQETGSRAESKIQSAKFNFLGWIDNHILLLLSGFLLAFIPLYPKIPLFDILPGYIVRVRAEDFFILFSLIVFTIQLKRRKVSLKTPLTKFIIAYALAGLASILAAVFIIHTVPMQLLHLGKTSLHYLRYLEYFSLFFITYTSIKTKNDLFFLLKVIILTLLGVFIYGVGQKYFYWPVYSTMNREFSKGIRLYLTKHARVQSTFAGHYDLGAYLVIILSLLVGLIFSLKHKWRRRGLSLVLWFGIWLLIVSAARTSFGGFIVAITFLIFAFTAQQKTRWLKIKYFLKQSIYIYGLLILMMIVFGNDLSDRLMQIVDSSPKMRQTVDYLNDRRKKIVKNYLLIPFHFEKPDVPKNAISTDEMLKIMVKSDQRPTENKPNLQRPSDVYVNVPDEITVATRSANGTMEITTIKKPRTYSINALKHGLSLAIRLDSLWPQAIRGFRRNPLTGSGYATLNKHGEYQFTEADSTDNNYLRTLGETGLVGFIIFYGIIVYVIQQTLIFIRKTGDLLLKGLAFGFLAGIIGLLINAIYIDVFAASKVAMIFWALVGMMLASFKLNLKKKHV